MNTQETDSDILHLFVAVAMMAPIFMFYIFIGSEMLGYRQPPVEQRIAFMSPSALAKACSAFATDKLQTHEILKEGD